MRLSALMYHDVTGVLPVSGSDSGIHDRYALPWNTFLAHLDAIAARVPRPPTATVELGRADAKHAWSLTFDDGGASAVVVAHELARRDWRAYFFITTGLVGTPGFVDAEGVRELDRLGHVVGSHTVTHPRRFASLGDEDIYAEWRDSVSDLSEMLGHPVRTGSVPGGDLRRSVVLAAVRAGIDVLFTSEPTQSASEVAGCLVLGRYAIVGTTTGAEAAAAAAGERGRWLRRAAGWNARKAAKRIGGRRYETLRRRALTRRRGGD